MEKILSTILDVTKALSPFAWPALILFLVVRFTKEIRLVLDALPAALGRVKGAKALGVELELENLSEKAIQVESRVLDLNVSPANVTLPGSVESLQASMEDSGSPHEEDPVSIIRAEAGRSPRSALFLASAYIEKELKKVLASLGLLGSYKAPRQGFQMLAQREAILADVMGAVDAFFSVRNRIAHEPSGDGPANEALESGIRILTALRAIPRPAHEVIRTSVPLFADHTGTIPVATGTGVMLRGRDQYGNPGHLTQIFPTTKTMTVGSSVSWEWNMSNTWPETWYRNPDTDEVTYAWSSSAEFTGRDINTL